MSNTTRVVASDAGTRPGFKKRTIFLIAYLVFAILPIYWMINMSFKTNEEIAVSYTHLTLPTIYSV